MSDLYCDDCGNRLRWRIMPRGNEATACPNCHPEYESDTVSKEEYSSVSHLIRNIRPGKERIFPVFACPMCGAGPDALEKHTDKTNYCEMCETSYPIYD